MPTRKQLETDKREAAERRLARAVAEGRVIELKPTLANCGAATQADIKARRKAVAEGRKRGLEGGELRRHVRQAGEAASEAVRKAAIETRRRAETIERRAIPAYSEGHGYGHASEVENTAKARLKAMAAESELCRWLTKQLRFREARKRGSLVICGEAVGKRREPTAAQAALAATLAAMLAAYRAKLAVHYHAKRGAARSVGQVLREARHEARLAGDMAEAAIGKVSARQSKAIADGLAFVERRLKAAKRRAASMARRMAYLRYRRANETREADWSPYAWR